MNWVICLSLLTAVIMVVAAIGWAMDENSGGWHE